MADNPFLTNLPGSDKNKEAARASPAMGVNPFLDAAEQVAPPAARGAIHLARTHGGQIMDLLGRQGQAVSAGVAGGNGVDAFFHGQSQGQQDANRAKIRHKMGLDDPSSFLGRTGTYQKASPFVRGFVDFGIDTALDPVSLFGGLEAKLAGRAIRGLAGFAGRTFAHAAPQAAKDVTKIAQGVGDQFTYGGSAKRELGEKTYNRAILGENRQAWRAHRAEEVLNERYAEATKGLTAEEKTLVNQINNGERQAVTDQGRPLVPPQVIAAAAAVHKLGRDAAYLRGTTGARERLAYNVAPLANKKFKPPAPKVDDGYGGTLNDLIAAAQQGKGKSASKGFTGRNAIGMTHADDIAERAAPKRTVTKRAERKYDLPENLREFAAPPGQGDLGPMSLRRNYLPGPTEAAEELGQRRPSEYNLLLPQGGRKLGREDFLVGDTGPEVFDAAWQHALRQAAQQGTAGRLREELGVRLGGNAHPALVDLFKRTPRAKGDARHWPEVAGDLWKGVVNIPKNTVTTMGLAHGARNVPALAFQSEGLGPAARTYRGALQQMKMTPAQRYEHLRPAGEAGLISPSPERENPISDFLSKLDVTIPQKSPVRGGQKLLGTADLTKGANAFTWAADDEARLQVIKAKVARGVPVEDAAAETLREMVDYGHRSNFTKALQYIWPFATFRSKIPAAIASSVARNPGRLMMADRATQGQWGSGNVDVGGRRFAMNNPTSDVLKLGGPSSGDPLGSAFYGTAEYGRAALADPLKMALSPFVAPHDPVTKKLKERFMTYGIPVLPHKKNGKIKAGYALDALAGYVPANLGRNAMGDFSDWKNANADPSMSALEFFLSNVLGGHVR